MDPFVRLTGVVAPLDRVNIDTDQIIPAVFLKRIERSGLKTAFSSPGDSMRTAPPRRTSS